MSLLTGSARRSAYALQVDAEAIVKAWGYENTVFITLTFGGGGDGPTIKKAQRCFDSFLKHSLKEIFPGGIKVLERGTKNGRVHFHLLCDAGKDVRTGVDFEALARGDRRSFGPRLRYLLAELRTAGQRYGFGHIVECDPIKTAAAGVARYLCKYISKHYAQRQSRDKGARLRSYWGTARRHRAASCLFSWAGERGERGWLWRAKLAIIAKLNGIDDVAESWSKRFGPRWAYHLGDYINAAPLNYYPKGTHAIKDGRKWDLPPGFMEENTEISFSRVRGVVEGVLIFGKKFYWINPNAEVLPEPPSWVENAAAPSLKNPKQKPRPSEKVDVTVIWAHEFQELEKGARVPLEAEWLAKIKARKPILQTQAD
jgi:hypothetical protein